MANKDFSEKESTLSTSKPSFELVFGGFKQIESSTIEGKVVNEKFRRKYPSKVGKLCKNVFPNKEK